MVNSVLQQYLNESDENLRYFVQEELILEATESIWEQLNSQGVTKTELAEKLGTSQSHVTQLLSGSRNMTLRTLADIAFALGRKVRIKFEEDQTEYDNGWGFLHEVVPVRAPYSKLRQIESANEGEDYRVSA